VVIVGGHTNSHTPFKGRFLDKSGYAIKNNNNNSNNQKIVIIIITTT